MAKTKHRKLKHPNAPAAFAAGDRGQAEALAWAHLRARNPRLSEKPADPAQRSAGLYALAGLLAEALDYDAAESVLEDALTLNPANIEARALTVHLRIQANDLDSAETAARAALESRPDAPLSHKLLIDVLFEKGRNAEILDRLDVLEAALPAHPQARFIRAETLARLGRDEEAARAYAAIEGVPPQLEVQVQTRLGDMHHNAEDYTAAESAYRRARLLAPGDAKATRGLINTYYAQGRITDGDQLAAQAYKAIPGFGKNHFDCWFPVETGLAPAAPEAGLDRSRAVLVNCLGELPGLPFGISLIKGYVEQHSDFTVTNLDLSADFYRDLVSAMKAGKASVAFSDQDKLFEAIEVFEPDNPGFYEAKTFREKTTPFFKYGSLFADRPRMLCQQAMNGQGPMPWFVRAYAERIVAAKPFVVGLSVIFNQQHHFAILLAKEIKRLNPDIVTVFGGRFFNSENLESFLAADWVDCLILHDGEVAFLGLLEALKTGGDLRLVPNIAFFDVDAEEVFLGTERPGVKLNDLAYADYSDFDLGGYFMPAPVMAILSSRGCYWRRCTFCDHFAPYAGSYKVQSIPRVVDELQHYVESYGVHHFSFVDEMISAKRFLRLSEEILKRGLDISYYAFAKPTANDFTPEVLETMSRAGCRAIYWGVESGSDRVLKLMDKGNDVKGTSQTLIAANHAGIRNHVFMIVGYPSETVDELKETVRFLYDHRNVIDKIIPSQFCMRKGTPVCDRYGDFGVAKVRRVRSLCNHRDIGYVSAQGMTEAEAGLYHQNLLYGFFQHFSDRGIYFGTIRDHIVLCYGHEENRPGPASANPTVPDPEKLFRATAARVPDDGEDKAHPTWPRTILLSQV